MGGVVDEGVSCDHCLHELSSAGLGFGTCRRVVPLAMQCVRSAGNALFGSGVSCSVSTTYDPRSGAIGAYMNMPWATDTVGDEWHVGDGAFLKVHGTQ